MRGWGRRDLRNTPLSLMFLKWDKVLDITAQSYKLGLLREKERNFLQILLIGGENLQRTPTEINGHSSPKANNSQKNSPATVDYQHSFHQKANPAFRQSTAFPAGAEECSVTSLSGSFEPQHLIGSGTNCLAGPRISHVHKFPTYPQCANDQNKCYNLDTMELSTAVNSLSSIHWLPTSLPMYYINCFLAGSLSLCLKPVCTEHV